MIIQSINWNINPEIFSLGPLSIRWYGLLFASAFFFGYLLFSKFFKKENISIEILDNLTIYMAIGTILGARLGHCLFYEPEYYLSNPIEIIKIWRGGLASHGAAVGILIALYLFVRKYKMNFLWLMDRIGIATALGGFFIRMGNLMNSEIYGIETDLPWGFVFLRNNETVAKHPTQIYEALSYLFIFLLLFFLYHKRFGKLKNGFLFSLFLILVFTMRFIIEFIKEVQVEFETGMALNMGQWLSIPFVIMGFVILYLIHRKKGPGMKGQAKNSKQ